MKVLLIEDEMLAAERLQLLLEQYDPAIQVLGCLESIEESVEWLKKNKPPDLLLMDIHLSDGHSFEIFRQVDLATPVIFTTAYDSYALDAFRHYSIDYILKPVTADALSTALKKYETFSTQVVQPQDPASKLGKVAPQLTTKYRDRFLAKVGLRTFFVQCENIAFFYADNKTVFLADVDGRRFIVNYSIERLESMLDSYHFFRVNRKIIVHSRMIDQVKPYFNNRLKITLRNQSQPEDIIVSRERVPAFKKWAAG